MFARPCSIWIIFAAVILSGIVTDLQAQTRATVNRVRITQDDLTAMAKLLGISNPTPEQSEHLLDRHIERLLLSQFLDRQHVKLDSVMLDEQVGTFVNLADHAEKPLSELLSKRGLTESQLRDYLSLDLKWQAYASQVVTAARIQEEFEQHRSHYDGTRLSLRVLYKKLPAQTDQKQAVMQQLSALKHRIEAGEISFEQAAAEHSDSPTGKLNGGLVENVVFHGQTPKAITQVAFQIPEGAISEPFETQFGGHLVQVVSIKAGQFSLDDAYPIIFTQLSDELKAQTIQRLTAEATIERP